MASSRYHRAGHYEDLQLLEQAERHAYYIAEVSPATWNPRGVKRRDRYREISSKRSEASLPIFSYLHYTSMSILIIYRATQPALTNNTRSATDHSRDLRQAKVLRRIKITAGIKTCIEFRSRTYSILLFYFFYFVRLPRKKNISYQAKF